MQNLNDEFMPGDAILVAPILTQGTFEREVYLPEGEWTNMITGEVTVGGQSVNVHANVGQIPVFLDNRSPDLPELLSIFRGIWWSEIKSFK